MSENWILVLIAFAPGIIGFLYKFLNTATRFLPFYYTHADFDIAVIEQDTKNQKVKIKIAYAGSSSLIIKGVELTSILSLASSKERIISWFQLARGYLTDDWEGLQTVLGQKYARKEPVWLRKTLNLILGILLSLIIISLLYNPFGWIILLIGPYSSLRIISSDVNTKDIQSGANQVLPFLIKPAEEREFLIDYTFAVKSRNFTSTKAKYVLDMPEKSLWKLPRPGHLILRGNVKLLIKTSGLFATHRINLGKKDFVLIPLQDN